jgi:hypothetical protein
MDNVVSKGWSQAVDHWNRKRVSSDRIQNPFKGYSTKVMPGLVMMAKQGRLEPGRDPNRKNFEEAMRLSRTLRMLPSQTLVARKVSGNRSGVRFHYPVRVVPVANEQLIVKLCDADKDSYLNKVKKDKRRLKEISGMKETNRKAYDLVNEIIKSYIEMAQKAKDVSDWMLRQMAASPLEEVGSDPSVPVASIPEITQLRKDIQTGIELHQERLSDLTHQYDDLKQKEWIVLNHLLQVRKDAIRKLMDIASLKGRGAEFFMLIRKESQQGGSSE